MYFTETVRRLRPETQSVIEIVNELRELARWYREFSDRAGEPAIWETRLLTAKELEEEADRLAAGLRVAREVENRTRDATHSPPASKRHWISGLSIGLLPLGQLLSNMLAG